MTWAGRGPGPQFRLEPRLDRSTSPSSQPRLAVPEPHGNNASLRTGSGSPAPITRPTLRVPRRHFIEERLDTGGSRGQGPLSQCGACPSQALCPLSVRWPCWPGRAPEVMGLQGQAARCRAGGTGSGGRGHGQPQTKVAWCGLALGLAGPPGAGLRPGASDVGGLLAGNSTPGTLRPSPGAEPTTRSTSMTGMLRPPPPVTERREAVTCLPQSPAGTRPHPARAAQTLAVGGVPPLPRGVPGAGNL